MKNTNIPFLFGTVLVASFAVIHCGGSDSPSSGPGETGGTRNAGGGLTTGTTTSGAGGNNSNAGGANNGGSNNGTAGANNGTAGADMGGAGTNGNAGNGGSGNEPSDAATVREASTNNPGCPAMAPRDSANCQTANEMCTYAAEECTCERANGGGGGIRRDGGVDAGFRGVWNCTRRIVDAGSRCPATEPADGDACEVAMVGICRFPMNHTCVCARIGRRDAGYEWACR